MLSGDPWRLEVSPRCDAVRHAILASAVAFSSAGACPEVSPHPSPQQRCAGRHLVHSEGMLCCVLVLCEECRVADLYTNLLLQMRR